MLHASSIQAGPYVEHISDLAEIRCQAGIPLRGQECNTGPNPTLEALQT